MSPCHVSAVSDIERRFEVEEVRRQALDASARSSFN